MTYRQPIDVSMYPPSLAVGNDESKSERQKLLKRLRTDVLKGRIVERSPEWFERRREAYAATPTFVGRHERRKEERQAARRLQYEREVLRKPRTLPVPREPANGPGTLRLADQAGLPLGRCAPMSAWISRRACQQQRRRGAVPCLGCAGLIEQ